MKYFLRWWRGVEEGSPGGVAGLLRNGDVGCEEQEQPWGDKAQAAYGHQQFITDHFNK